MIDMDLLRKFENGLNPRHPERSALPARVLGYGEISTVLEIETDRAAGLAFKRLPMFQDEPEAAAYAALYAEYVTALEKKAGLPVAASEVCWLTNDRGQVVLYIVQQKFDPAAIGHKMIHRLSQEQTVRLACAALREAARVFTFNREQQGILEMGLDAQISNWAVQNPESLDGEPRLVYLDTSTPLMRVNGVEQLNPDLFLRSAPSFLVWMIRWLFLEEVMTRYYDFRRVTMDLAANFYKEQRPELVPSLVDAANRFLAEQGGGCAPLTVAEVQKYYRQDAVIWRFYLAARKADRRLRRLVGREYPYILPEKIRR